MELRRLWHLVWHRKLLIVVLVAVGVAAGYQATPRVPRYKASAMLFVGVSETYSPGVFSNDLLLGRQQLAATFAAMVPSLNVAQAAVASGTIPRSAGEALAETTSQVLYGTSLIRVSVTDRDPHVAQALVNAVSSAFVGQMLRIDPVTATLTEKNTSPRSPVSVSQEATLPFVPISTGLTRAIILSGLFAFVLAIGLVLLLDYLDLTVRSPEDLERRSGLPVLGTIPLYSRLSDRDYVVPGTRLAGVPRLDA